MSTQRLDLVGITEIAGMLGVPRSTIRVWRVRGRLPVPATELACGPIWFREDIEEWAAQRSANTAA